MDKVVVGCPCSKLLALWFVFFLSITGCHTHTHTHGCTLTHMVQLDDGRETNLDLGYVIGRPAKPNQMRRSHSANRSSATLLQLLFCLFFSSSLSLSLPLYLHFLSLSPPLPLLLLLFVRSGTSGNAK